MDIASKRWHLRYIPAMRSYELRSRDAPSLYALLPRVPDATQIAGMTEDQFDKACAKAVRDDAWPFRD